MTDDGWQQATLHTEHVQHQQSSQSPLETTQLEGDALYCKFKGWRKHTGFWIINLI